MLNKNELIEKWQVGDLTFEQLQQEFKKLNENIGDNKLILIGRKIKGGNINGYRGEV